MTTEEETLKAMRKRAAEIFASLGVTGGVEVFDENTGERKTLISAEELLKAKGETNNEC